MRRVGIARSHGRLEEFDHYVEMLTQDEMPAEALDLLPHNDFQRSSSNEESRCRKLTFFVTTKHGIKTPHSSMNRIRSEYLRPLLVKRIDILYTNVEPIEHEHHQRANLAICRSYCHL